MTLMSPSRLEWMLVLIVTILLTCKIAFGEEQPCRREGDRISCTERGFKVLTDKIIDLKAEAQGLDLKLDAARQNEADARKALEECIATIPPPPPPKKLWKPITGYALGVVGTVGLVLAAALDTSFGARAGTAALGVGALAGGFVLVLPND